MDEDLPDENRPPCRHQERDSLLKKYDIPLSHLDFAYVERCTSGKELERILEVLQSGQEGHYPQLQQRTEECLARLKPSSRFIRKTLPVLSYNNLDAELRTGIADDLTSWLGSVQSQSAELDQYRTKNVDLNEVPQVRAHKPEVPSDDHKKCQRIKSTDYAQWDRYDPDTEILKMDLETERLQARSIQDDGERDRKCSVRFAEFLTNTEAEYEANREREKGNEFYKSGEYLQAVMCYTNSIHFLPSATNHNNRAQAYIKLGKYMEAVDDCKNALRYDKDNLKAFLRLAQSLEHLGSYREAYIYAVRVITIDPNNTSAQNLLNKIQPFVIKHPEAKTRMKITEINDENDMSFLIRSNRRSILKSGSAHNSHVLLPIPGPSTMDEPYFVVVENKDPELVKKQQFILDNKPQVLYLSNIDTDDEECLVDHNQKRNRMQQDQKILEEQPEMLPKTEEINVEETSLISECINEQKRFDSENIDYVNPCWNNNDEEMIPERNNQQEQTTNIIACENSHVNNANTEMRPANESGGGGEPHVDLNGNNIETTLEDYHLPFSFLCAWRSAQNDQSYTKCADILRSIDSDRLTEVIGYKLDGNMLRAFIRTLYLHFTVPHEVERVYAYILNISQLPRFNIIAMFQMEDDRQRMRSIFEFLEQHGLALPNEIKKHYMGM